ncbi:hypothetical protein [Massilia sp. YIM B04103]|uniref:hypothetical protein n=1 Tax=Massilia sp. YIM B04103 TaxID=2963106 RepID=UPI00210D9A11|nr:hypothetical protein [Massilia sp. YIM B04103]
MAEASPACQASMAQVRGQLATLPTISLMAVRDGEVLFSYGAVDRANQVYSVRKNVLAMMYGPPVAAGTISLDSSLASLDIDDVGGLLPLERSAKVGDLLAARSSVYHLAANPGDDAETAPPLTRAADMHPPSAARRQLDYGLMWWIPALPADSPLAGAYMAWGYYGQFILVVPKQRMVISHQRVVTAAEGSAPRKVSPAEFLRIANMLVQSPCL